MEIKPTGPGANLPSIGDGDQSVEKTFSKRTDAASQAALTPQENVPLSSALAGYQKADLQDPGKVEKMLSQCANGLLTDALGQSGASLPAGENSYLTGWLHNDPSIRGKLLSYLERVLK